MNANFTYLVRMLDMTYETFNEYGRAHRIAAAIRRHAEKTGAVQWRCSNGQPFYVGPGQIIEKNAG